MRLFLLPQRVPARLATAYRFGRFELRPATRELLVEGTPAALGSRAFDVLHALIEHRDRVLTKEQLLDSVWPGVIVEENSLQVQISALRKVLGSDAIATISGRGYRFAREVMPAVAEPAQAAAVATHNLPQQVTSFVGRERELEAARELLASSRLLTLTGAGGLGKTRLSLQLAANVLEQYRDGAFFVEFAPLTDARSVPQAVASALGVQEEAGRPVLETVLAKVKDRTLLLILDNCEHLVPTCADLAKRLLQSSARLKVLATSREALRIAGETIYSVPPLSLPVESGMRSGDLGRYEAVRLFVERAMAASPSFRLIVRNQFFSRQPHRRPRSRRRRSAMTRANTMELRTACPWGQWTTISAADIIQDDPF